VSDVEVSIGFGGEACADDRAVDFGVFGEDFFWVDGPGEFAGCEGVVVGGCGHFCVTRTPGVVVVVVYILYLVVLLLNRCT